MLDYGQMETHSLRRCNTSANAAGPQTAYGQSSTDLGEVIVWNEFRLESPSYHRIHLEFAIVSSGRVIVHKKQPNLPSVHAQGAFKTGE